MKILALRKFAGDGNTVAFFDVEVSPDIRMFNLKLVRSRSGWRVFAPSAFHQNTAAFSPAFADQLARLALINMGEVSNGPTAEAA